MRLCRGVCWFVLSALTVLAPAPDAYAWTRTVVKGAHASVDVERDGTLRVFLRLEVDVLAGWLHELELADLGEDVELNRYQPPYFRSAEGKVRRPKVEVTDDGRVRLSFKWKDAPKRGEHRVYIRYRTKADVSLVDVGGTRKARIVWSVPAWETGLHGVRVDMRAPKGSSVPPDAPEMPPGARYEVREHTVRTFVEWRRIHLPRITTWPLTIDVPVDALTLEAQAPEEAPRPPVFRSLALPESTPPAWALFFLAVLLLAKRRSIEMRMDARALLIRAGWPVVLVATGGLLAMGQWLVENPLTFAIPLLALTLHRSAGQTPPPERRAWFPSSFRALPRHGASIHELLDGTTTPGLLVHIACSGLLVAIEQPAAAVLALPAFLIGTRHHLAPTPAERTRMLTRFAEDLRVDSAPEMAFSWELSTDGVPRLGIALPGRRTGLLSVSFVVGASTVGLVRRRKVLLSVETRAQSEADDVVRRRLGPEPSLRDSDGRIFRLVEWNSEAVELLRALACKAPKPGKTSRGTWLLREISQPEKRAA